MWEKASKNLCVEGELLGALFSICLCLPQCFLIPCFPASKAPQVSDQARDISDIPTRHL